ncbi:MAG: rhodanese-like domain-containing protein [Blastochloris sp.]|jgi:rhodanese-related sulfurtransferase|nr:rhodanese-like domain-containing protein [Blastochloris sp.]
MKHSPAFQALCEDAQKNVKEISAQETQQKIELGQTLVFDVREDHEVAQGLIAGAKHLGRGIIERDIENLVPDKQQEIILYCGGGYRSALAAVNLQKMGYGKILSMAGGWRTWKELSLPTQQP